MAINFQLVIDCSDPEREPKTVKNRLHLDICASGRRAVPMATRKQRVDPEARRLTGL